MNQTAVAERIVAQMTVRVAPVVFRSRRELGCGIAATAGVIRRTGTVVVGLVVVRLVADVVVRPVIVRLVADVVVRPVVVRLVVDVVVGLVIVRLVVEVVVRPVIVWLVVDVVVRLVIVVIIVVYVGLVIIVFVAAAYAWVCTHIPEVVVIVSAGIYAGSRVPAALSCLTAFVAAAVAAAAVVTVLRYNLVAVGSCSSGFLRSCITLLGGSAVLRSYRTVV